jgi:hypothetical protein
MRPRTKAIGCGYDGKGGENCGIAHLGDRFDGDFTHRSPVILRVPEMADHVLNHNNRVVYKNADAEDQGE